MIDAKTYRAETHVINTEHRLFKYCNEMCFKSKNLYNYVNYLMRKEFIETGKVTSAYDYNKILKNEDVFRALPAKTSQQIILKLAKNWKSFFKAVKDWSKDKSKYTGKPSLPKYKNKDGRNIVMFDYQQTRVKDGKLKFPLTKITINTNVSREQFRQLQIVPYGSCYKICIYYQIEIFEKETYNNNYLAIDLGVDNLATLTNNIGQQPIVVNGKILKSINQYYNKKISKARSYVGNKTSKRMKKISHKRNNIVETHFHHISRWIINYCKAYDIDTIVIGKNKDWKRSSTMNRKSNQKFIQLPYEMFIHQLKYKGEVVGIRVVEVIESYTSKASFIDGDEIPTKYGEHEFSGKRISRGMYISKDGTLINADVNGSYNILRKCNAQLSYESIEGVSLHPVRLNIAPNKKVIL